LLFDYPTRAIPLEEILSKHHEEKGKLLDSLFKFAQDTILALD
jgi:hypothetical protein